MGSPNTNVMTPEKGKLTLFKKGVAVCTSVAIAGVFLQCLPPKMRSYAEAVTGETPNGFTYSIEGEKVSITGWTGDKETVTSLNIPATVDGQAVNAIGANAFEKYPKLTTVSIPDTVAEIGWDAFSYSGLTSITLPEGIQKLSYQVFRDCKELKELTLPKGFPKDGMSCGSFYGMGTLSSLSDSCIETIIFEDGMEEIPDYCARSAPTLKKLVIPSSVTSIGAAAFYDNDALTELELPSTIKNIGTEAFACCDGLTEVVLPDGIESTDDSIFSHCDNLKSVTLPSTLKEPGRYLFSDCKALTSVTIPEGMEKLKIKTFEGCESLKEITIPSTMKEAGSALDKSFIETVNIADGMETIPDSLCAWTEHVTTINIPDSVTSLGSRLFGSASGIKEFTVPSQITGGSDVFNGSGLEAIHFKAGFTKIPDSFCAGADKLTSIEWTDDITEIGDRAFIECKSLETADIPNTVKTIGNSAFSYCESVKSIHLPENGCKIGAYIFSGCNSLEEAYVPAGLYGEGSEATYYLLYNCASLKSVTFAEGVTAIPQACCRACEALTEVRLPEGLEEIGYQAFKNCKSLGSVTIPDSVTLIRREAFEFCESLNEVKLPADLTEIGSYAFNGCSSLYEIKLPKALTTIGGDAFNCGLREVWFEDGTEKIPDSACKNAHLLETAHIPASVKVIDNSAFHGCYELSTLDMPFEKGDLIPNENFFYYTFYECYSLTDERVIPYQASGTFVNHVECSNGDGGLVNYTVYYSLNPVFKDIYKNGTINVYTKNGNPIVARSLPVGLRSDELEQFFYRTNYTIPDGAEMGVFRFSTEPEDGADTTVEVRLEVVYTTGYKTHSKLIRVDNNSKGWEPVSLTVPENAKVADGKTSFDVYGSAPVGKEVTVYVNGEAAVTAMPNQYTGRYYAKVEASAGFGDSLELYAQSGEIKSAKVNVNCNNYSVDVEKVILLHNNNHTGYKLDITGAFKQGQKPYIAYNPSRPLGFEVTLNNNDCARVSVSSTTNDKTSCIPLEFDEATGTWKGEGFFDTRVPGTLGIIAVPRIDESTLTFGKDENGSDTLVTEDGTVLMSAESIQNDEAVNEFLKDFAHEIDISTDDCFAEKFIAKDLIGNDVPIMVPSSFVPLSGYATSRHYSSDASEKPGFILFGRKIDTVTLNGKTYTAEDLINLHQQSGIKLKKTRVRNSDGSYSTYYVHSFTESDSSLVRDITSNMPFDSRDPKRGTVEQYLSPASDNLIEGALIIEKNEKTNETTVSTSFYSNTIDFFKDQLGGVSTSSLLNWMKSKVGKIVGPSVAWLMSVGQGMIDIYGHSEKLSMRWEQIENSNNPAIKEHQLWYKSLAVLLFFMRCRTAAKAAVASGMVALSGATFGVSLLAGVIIGVYSAVMGFVLDIADSYLDKELFSVGNAASVNSLIDPSGIAYEWLPSNPVEGVTAEIYYKDDSGTAVKWNAEDYDQVNPQITDSAGWFAWDVPEGMWQVRVSGEGYEDAQSEWLPVLPVQTDVNIKLTSTLPAEIADAGYSGGKAMVKFTKHMLDESITDSSLILTDKNGKAIACDIAPMKEEGNDTETSMTFILTPKTETSIADANIAVKSDALSYAGVACANSKGIALRALSDDEIPQPVKADYTLGDVNDDGKVDAKDASMILVEYSKASTGAESGFNESQKLAGEVNSDGKIDAKDASAILAYYAMASTATGDVPSLKEYMAKSKQQS